MAYEIVREEGRWGFNVLNEEGHLVDHDRYFIQEFDARWVVETRYPGIKELGSHV